MLTILPPKNPATAKVPYRLALTMLAVEVASTPPPPAPRLSTATYIPSSKKSTQPQMKFCATVLGIVLARLGGEIRCKVSHLFLLNFILENISTTRLLLLFNGFDE